MKTFLKSVGLWIYWLAYGLLLILSSFLLMAAVLLDVALVVCVLFWINQVVGTIAIFIAVFAIFAVPKVWVTLDASKWVALGIDTDPCFWRYFMFFFPIVFPAYIICDKIVWPLQLKKLEELKQLEAWKIERAERDAQDKSANVQHL